MTFFWLVLRQTIVIAFRKGGGALGTLAFYVIVVTLFTFALGPEIMRQHSAAALAVALLLSLVTALPQFYERDHEDGTLEQFLLQPMLLEVLVLAKITGQCIASAGPLLLVSPMLAVMAGLDSVQTADAILRLALAAPTLVALGSMGAALTLGTRRGGLLQALIILPLTVPVLIFAAAEGQGAVWFLSGAMLAALPVSCYVTAALIRLSQD